MKKPGFILGIRYFFKGFPLIRVAGVKRFVIIPLLINITLFTGALWFGISWIEGWIKTLQVSMTASSDDSFAWLNHMIEWLSWIIIPLFIVLFLAVMFYTFALIANLIAAPFNGLLSEKIEAYLTGGATADTTNASMMELSKNIGGAFLSEFRKLLYFIIRAIPLFILFFIPIINVLAGFLWFAFSAWMLSIEYNDFPMNNHDIQFPRQRLMLQENKLFTLGFGTATLTATMIPFLNFLAMPVAVAGATAMWVDHWQNRQPIKNLLPEE